ncbi:MAG: MFS transporter [Oligoflexia bacterium]|nr:MFS transporter [Oligoflexia bacterium]
MGKSTGNHWKQLGLLCLGTSFFGNGTLGITKSVLSVLLQSLGFTGTEIGFISGARGFKAVADIPAGHLSDKIGRKKVAYCGKFLLIIAHWMMGLSHSFWAFFIARSIHGVGSAFNAGAATFGAADLLKRSRGLGQGLLEMANYGSHTIFAAVAGILALNYGVRAPFFILGIAPLFGFLIVWKYLKEPRDLAREDDDRDNPHGHAHTEKADSVSTMKFVGYLLTNPKMLSVFFAGLLTKFADDGLLTMLLPLWAKSQGFSLMQVATMATVAHGSFTIFVVFAGWMSDKIGRKVIMVAGTLVCAGACLMVVALTKVNTLGVMMTVAVLISLGNALIYPVAPAATADVVPEHLRATGMGVYKLVHDAGIFIGPVMMGIGFDRAGVSNSFGVAAMVFLVGTLLLSFCYVEKSKIQI